MSDSMKCVTPSAWHLRSEANPAAAARTSQVVLAHVVVGMDRRRWPRAAAYRPCRQSTSACRTCSTTPAQSPRRSWRNSRVRGYQGVSARPRSQRQSTR